MVTDLTAHRTFALRDALAAVVYALALKTFYPPYDQAGCLEIKTVSVGVGNLVPGIEDSPAGCRINDRHAAWATRLPREAGDLWPVVLELDTEGRLDLLAHCAGLTVNAVHNPLDRKPKAWAHADRLAEALHLDMISYWTPTVDGYLGRVTKARIREAVTDAVSAEAAERIGGLKKQPMAEAAEQRLARTGWLPPLLRTTTPPTAENAQPDPMALAAE